MFLLGENSWFGDRPDDLICPSHRADRALDNGCPWVISHGMAAWSTTKSSSFWGSLRGCTKTKMMTQAAMMASVTTGFVWVGLSSFSGMTIRGRTLIPRGGPHPEPASPGCPGGGEGGW